MKTRQLISRAEMKTQLIKLLENTHDGFLALDRQWRYVYVNPVVERDMRKTSDELIGKTLSEVAPGSLRTPLFRKYKQALETGRVMEFDEQIGDKWYDIHITPIETGIWISYHDITEQKLIGEHKDEFIRMTSHELKTPITSLKLYAELLRDLATTEEAAEYINNINKQANHLNEIITDMLDLSHIEMGRLKFEKRRFDLLALIKDLDSDLQKNVPQFLETDFQLEEAIVYGDKMRLRQAVTNLINNASKYSPGRDRIIVTATKNNKHIELAVRDFGVGIDPAYRDRIFTRFFQPSTSKGKNFPGLGIGLYLVKTIIDKHHGTVKVDSAPNEGSTFTISLPIVERKISFPKHHGKVA